MDICISAAASVNSRSFKIIPIDKYVPTVIGKDHAKKLHLLELERWRTNECELNGKKYLYKVSSLVKDENSGGTATCSLIHPRCPLYASIQCYSTTPYSVYLGSKRSPTIRIDFQPSDLYSVICSITKVVKVN